MILFILILKTSKLFELLLKIFKANNKIIDNSNKADKIRNFFFKFKILKK